ncbi:MAG: hypothetical protein ACRDNK_04245 [Solirubrobacteraceae bacterium]
MSDIKLPGVGPVKKPYLIAGVAVFAGIIGYAYFKRSRANAAAAADTSSTTTSTAAATDPSQSIDPSTGLTYAEEAAGSSTGYGQPGYGGFSSEPYSPYGYDIYGNPIPAPTGAGSGGALTTNDEWASQAETDLGNANITLAVSSLAIGRVLAGLTVTSAQRDIFMQGVGLLGEPPQGYPKPIKLSDTGTTPPPPAATNTNIKNRTFVKVTKATTWNDEARAYNTFSGNGAALHAYNLLPGKHAPTSYASISKDYPNIPKNPAFTIAIPESGKKITLPGVGTVTS